MRGRCGADDSRRRRGYEARAQSLGHDEIGHVIEREHSFEPVFGELARALMPSRKSVQVLKELICSWLTPGWRRGEAGWWRR
jgi:hypothetical protein